MIQISSESNEHYRRLCALKNAKGIREHGEFILMGEKLIREFLKNPGPWKLTAEVVKEGLAPFSKRGTTLFHLSEKLFNDVDVLGTKFNLFVLEPRAFAEANLQVEAQGLELICPLGDPANLGAVIRSAVAFGVSKVILTSEAVHPLHPKSIKASAGAVLQTTIERTGPLASVRSSGSVYALDSGGRDLGTFSWPRNARLVIGEEGPGLPELAGVPRLSILTTGVESLNATVAASIAFYSYRSQQSKV